MEGTYVPDCGRITLVDTAVASELRLDFTRIFHHVILKLSADVEARPEEELYRCGVQWRHLYLGES